MIARILTIATLVLLAPFVASSNYVLLEDAAELIAVIGQKEKLPANVISYLETTKDEFDPVARRIILRSFDGKTDWYVYSVSRKGFGRNVLLVKECCERNIDPEGVYGCGACSNFWMVSQTGRLEKTARQIRKGKINSISKIEDPGIKGRYFQIIRAVVSWEKYLWLTMG